MSLILKWKKSKKFNIKQPLLGAWRGSSRSKLYEELGWNTQSDRRKCRRVLQIHKIFNNKTPSYLKDKLPLSCRALLMETFATLFVK